MGILDSNKVLPLVKSGVLSVSAETAGDVGSVISVKEYSIVCFRLTGLTNAKMSVICGVENSGWGSVELYNAFTDEKVGIRVGNGTYYAFVSQFNDMQFHVPVGGVGETANIGYFLSTEDNPSANTQVLNKIYSSAFFTQPLSKENVALDVVGNQIFDVSGFWNYRDTYSCLRIDVSLSAEDNTLVLQYKPFKNGSVTIQSVIDEDGNIVNKITKSGSYYVNSIPMTDSIYIRCDVAGASGLTGTIKLSLCKNTFTAIKHIQKVAEVKATAVTSGNLEVVMHSEVVPHFKFFFVRCVSNKGFADGSKIQLIPTYNCTGVADPWVANKEIMLDGFIGTDKRLFQTEWQEILCSEEIRAKLIYELASEGNIGLSIYGVV